MRYNTRPLRQASPNITKADTAAARVAPKRNSKGSAGSSGTPELRTSSLAEAGGTVSMDEA